MNDTERLITETLLGMWPRCAHCGERATLRPRDASFTACWCYGCVRDHGYPEMQKALEPIQGAAALGWLAARLAAQRTEK